MAQKVKAKYKTKYLHKLYIFSNPLLKRFLSIFSIFSPQKGIFLDFAYLIWKGPIPLLLYQFSSN